MIFKFALLFLAYFGSCDDDFDIPELGSSLKASYKLMHSYDGKNWEERGTITITSHGDKRRKPLISIKNHSFNKEKLDLDGLYYVGIYKDEDSKLLIQSAIRTCNLVAADLLDNVSVYLDLEKGQILAVNYQASLAGCAYSTSAAFPQTTMEVGMVKEALKPIYTLPKVEDPQEQQSFFRKYWWVFLIGFFIMMNSAGNPQAQGQGQAQG
ncbi:unnamed protein product [Blepharisma stoltei]|uniref:ER membrane protein complex subunit 10 n=1 Tax=Blepharisma stoltei TaxID=1481888 RepID=A0AAU9JIG3_9CILI|nr:unnamed protein product [Blepharisma stoltei]